MLTLLKGPPEEKAHLGGQPANEGVMAQRADSIYASEAAARIG
jgi:hypothetical protein